ncbi:MAG: hypothetical protein Kow0099_01570 [Candidatus Abyssubacteria bacterium]
MSTKTVFLLGVCVGAAILIVKAVKPLGAYALAGGMVAYEAACDAVEASREALEDSVRRVRARRNSAK